MGKLFVVTWPVWLVQLVAVLALAAVVASCEDNYVNPQQSALVVEGWIEEGGFPIVMLTKSVAIKEEYQDLSDLSAYLIRWAKVTVYNGEDSVVLTGKYDADYMPPYIYTTTRMRGKAGHSYSLKVEYRGFLATATTTVLPAPVIEAVTLEPSGSSDSLFHLSCRFYDDPLQKNYYQIFSRVGAESKQYLASFLGALDDAVLSEHPCVTVYRGRQLGAGEYFSGFSASDTVAVKVSQIDAASYQFWDDYTKNLTLSENLMFPVYSSIRSNIVGGSGYWCGMGSSIRYVIVSEMEWH